tara:strand:- start:331 stop:522 length:192 start_codon:yes stop_codon:yes gene_type:complete
VDVNEFKIVLSDEEVKTLLVLGMSLPSLCCGEDAVIAGVIVQVGDALSKEKHDRLKEAILNEI